MIYIQQTPPYSIEEASSGLRTRHNIIDLSDSYLSKIQKQYNVHII